MIINEALNDIIEIQFSDRGIIMGASLDDAIINPVSASYVHLQDWNIVITVSADVLAPLGLITSADTVLTTQNYTTF